MLTLDLDVPKSNPRGENEAHYRKKPLKLTIFCPMALS